MHEHEALRFTSPAAPATPNSSQALIVSGATIKSQVDTIFAKLGGRDRAAAIVFAYDYGIVEPQITASGRS